MFCKNICVDHHHADTTKKPSTPKHDVDRVAVAVCMLTRTLVSLATLNFMTIGPPYTMTVFQWTSAQSVLYLSVCMGLVGLNIVFWNCAYVFLDLRKRLSERRAVVLTLVSLLGAYLVTYPWPFLAGTIPYARQANQSLPRGQHLQPGLALPEAALELEEATGCNPAFRWCAQTPAVNMEFFLGSLILVMGFAMPICHINLDILFSKVLGDIRQVPVMFIGT